MDSPGFDHLGLLLGGLLDHLVFVLGAGFRPVLRLFVLESALAVGRFR